MIIAGIVIYLLFVIGLLIFIKNGTEYTTDSMDEAESERLDF